MTFKEYQLKIKEVIANFDEDLVMGVEESLESIQKNTMLLHKQIRRGNYMTAAVIEEIGDVLATVTHICNILALPLEDLAKKNVESLDRRLEHVKKFH